MRKIKNNIKDKNIEIYENDNRKFEKIIIKNNDFNYIDNIIKSINKNINVEIQIDNTIKEEDANKIYEFISSKNRNIGICVNMICDDNSKIFKLFKSYITTINIDNCCNIDKLKNDLKIIHFDGDIIDNKDKYNIVDSKSNDKIIYNLIKNNLNDNKDKEIFTFIDFDNPNYEESYTYEGFNKKVDEVAKALINLNIKKNSHVAIWMNNLKEWFIYFFAIEKIGAIAVPINKDNREYDMDYVLKNNDIELLIMTNGHEKNRYMDTMKKLIPDIKNGTIKNTKYPHLKNIITINFEEKGLLSDKKFISDGKVISDFKLEDASSKVYNDDIAIILPTSGTTGKSKGVMLTHESIIHNGFYIGDNLNLKDDDIMGIIVTMFHCFGVTLSMIASMTHNSKMIIPEIYIRPIDTLKMINKYNITCLNGAPKHFEGLIESYDKFIEDEKTKITSLKKGIMAGANCSSKLMDAVDKIFNMNIISVYGQTELSPGDIMSNVNDSSYIRHNTVGKKFDYVDIKIVDDNNDEVLEGKIGEIVVKSPDIMTGYYGDIIETNKMYDEKGYFHSGDLAIKNGCYYKIVGRKKNMIIRNGENIQPMEVEEAIKTINGINEVFVFGSKIDDTNNQNVVAVVKINNNDITENYIISKLKDKIAGYKIPCKIYFVDDLKYNANGKISINNQIDEIKKIEVKKLVKTLKNINI